MKFAEQYTVFIKEGINVLAIDVHYCTTKNTKFKITSDADILKFSLENPLASDLYALNSYKTCFIFHLGIFIKSFAISIEYTF